MGIWQRVNSRLGTLFDLFEQEIVTEDSIEEFARALDDEVANLRLSARGGVVRARIAKRVAPIRKDEWVELAVAEIDGWEKELVSFAREVAREGGALVVEM